MHHLDFFFCFCFYQKDLVLDACLQGSSLYFGCEFARPITVRVIVLSRYLLWGYCIDEFVVTAERLSYTFDLLFEAHFDELRYNLVLLGFAVTVISIEFVV